MSQEKILITFKSRGDTQLEKSILKIAKAQAILEQNERKLNQATEALNNSQKKHTATIDRQKKSLLDLNGSLRLTNNNFATLRSKLLLASFGFMLFQQGVMRFVNAASRQEEILNKFNTVFGQNADEVAKWADSYGDSIGRATSDLMEMASGLQDIFVPMGFLRSEASELSKGLTQLAIDVASFSNASDEEVINAFKSAVVGNHETVRKYGIVITQAALKQEALTSGIIESDRAMTEQEKVLARINLLTNGTADAQGDAEKTADSFANRVKALQAAWKEFSEDMGRELIPAIIKVMDFLQLMSPILGILAPRVLELAAAYLIFKSRLVVVTATMKLYNALALTGIKLSRKLKLAVARSGVGLLIVGIAELIHRTGLLGSATDESSDSFDKGAVSAKNYFESLKEFSIALARTDSDLDSIKNKLKSLQDFFDDSVVDSFKELPEWIGGSLWKTVAPFGKDGRLGMFFKGVEELVEEHNSRIIKGSEHYFKTVEEVMAEAIKLAKVDVWDPGGPDEQTLFDFPQNEFIKFGQFQRSILDALNLEYLKLNDTQAILLDTEKNRQIIQDLKTGGDKLLIDLEERKEQLYRRQQVAMAELLPSLEKEGKLLQAKLATDGAVFEMEKLKIENAAIFKDLTDENINAIFRQLEANEKLNKEIKKQNDLEKENERIIKAQKKERDAQISSLVRATTQFALYSQEVAKNMKELTEVILGELQKILTQFITNQILFSIFGIGDAPTLFGKTFDQLLQGITGGASGSSPVQGANDLAFGVAHSGGMIQSYHQGGNVPIIAQEGEFVMRRSAVESIGVENLNRMNRTGNAGVNVTFSGNVLSKSFIEREAIPMIKKAIRRGKTLG